MRPESGARAHHVELSADHPGFHDPAYRARRDAVARLAESYAPGTPVPDVAYTVEEQATWRAVWDALLPLHRSKACALLRDRGEELALFAGPIPQLEALNAGPLAASGFRFEPVTGLVPPREFFASMADGVFRSTQYMRHPSRPLYTPEPDVVHELVGHAASLTIPRIADVNRAFGRAARAADDLALRRIERVYWFTMEFGVVLEDGAPRAFGAGLLSSAGELGSFDRDPELRPFDVETVASTDYETSAMQPLLFVAPSTDALLGVVERWLGA